MSSAAPERTAARVVACREAELPPDARMLVEHGRRRVALFNVGGRLHAVSARCPHHGGPLCHGRIGGTRVPSDPARYEWGMPDRVLTCPWHGWQFDLETGAALFDPAVGVPVYPVAVEHGEVVVYVT